MAPTKERPATKTIATNREARHEYFVLEALETGVELKGTEVKSLRAGGVNLKDSWVDIEDGELLVKGMHISPYDHGNMFNQDPMRVRRLLAHKSDLRSLSPMPEIFSQTNYIVFLSSILSFCRFPNLFSYEPYSLTYAYAVVLLPFTVTSR